MQALFAYCLHGGPMIRWMILLASLLYFVDTLVAIQL